MKKLYKIRILKFIALLLPIALILLFAQTYYFHHFDQNAYRFQQFYNEEEDSLDVVLMGASQVYTGFSPAYAYEKYGFTSYLYASAANPGSLYKYQLKEILKTQNPQLIIVETNGFYEANDTFEARLRTFTENIPPSLNKLDAILHYEYEDKLSCVLPFIKYHGEWQNFEDLHVNFLHKINIGDQPSRLKGLLVCAATNDDVPIYDIQNDNSVLEIGETSKAYLIDFLEYCKSEQLDNIVFVRFPHKIGDEYSYDLFCYANNVAEIINQYGYTYLNLEKKAPEIGIDYMNDFFDYFHMNIDGQVKMTEYLGEFIIDNYQITPVKQTAENKAQWEESVLYTKLAYEFVQQHAPKDEEFSLVEHSMYEMDILEEMKNRLN